jgi:polyphosphate kinase 2 (PPK2 family)
MTSELELSKALSSFPLALYLDLLPFRAVMLFSLANQRQFVSELNVTSVFPQVRCLNQFMGFLSNSETLEKYLVSQVYKLLKLWLHKANETDRLNIPVSQWFQVEK